jgi:hypothetical protein
MAIKEHKRQSTNPTLKTQKCKRKAEDTTYIFFILLGGFWRAWEGARAGEAGGGGGGVGTTNLTKGCKL